MKNRYLAWRDRAPLPVIFVLLFVVWTAAQIAFRSGDSHGLRWDVVVVYVLGGLLFAGVLTAIIARQRRRSGGTATFADINLAIRSGELPSDADPAVWVPELNRRELLLRRNRWLSPIVLGGVLLVSVGLLFLGGSPLLPILCIVLFAAALVLTLWQGRRALAKIESLQTQLEGRGSYEPHPTY